MGTGITDTTITSDQTDHSAEYSGSAWTVTYLPGVWTRNQAITAVTLAEMFAELYRARVDYQTAVTNQVWVYFSSWSAELDMTGEQVWDALADTYPPMEG